MRMLIFGIALLFDGLALAQPILDREPPHLKPPSLSCTSRSVSQCVRVHA
jgi:hypothetical protein